MNETLNNLAKAFIGESIARNKYTLFAEIAEREGLAAIAEAFTHTANQEKAHAKMTYMLITDLARKENIYELKVQVNLLTGIGDTIKNLESSLKGETLETTDIYPEFASVAEKEGYEEVAGKFQALSRAEQNHAAKYRSLLDELKKSRRA